MKIRDIKTFYRGRLPHIVPIGAIFFVTFRLQDSIPKKDLHRLRQKFENRICEIPINDRYRNAKIYETWKEYFTKYDDLLDTIKNGPEFLKIPKIAKIVTEQLHRFDNDLYTLIAYCIMSNHVHMLIDTSVQLPSGFDQNNPSDSIEFEPLQVIMKRIKGPSAIYANRILRLKGRFWQKESYDHFVRSSKELNNIILYILNNPVKAGIVNEYEEYPFLYLKDADD